MAEEDFDEKNEQTKSALDSMLATTESNLDSQRQKQFEQEFIESQGKLNTGEAYQAAMDELRTRGIGPTDKIRTYNPQSQRFDTQEIRQPFLNRTAPALTPSGIDPRMAREMLDYAETNQFSFAPNISSPLQELADNAYGTGTGRNQEGITPPQVDPRNAQISDLEKQLQEAGSTARGFRPNDETRELQNQIDALRQEMANKNLAKKPDRSNKGDSLVSRYPDSSESPRNMDDLTNEEEDPGTTMLNEMTEIAKEKLNAQKTGAPDPYPPPDQSEDQTDEQKYKTFAERRMQRNLDNLGLGDSDEAKALALRLDAAGISSLRFGAFIKQNNRDRLALGKAAHSDLDSYVGDFLLTQAEKEISGKSSRYGIRKNYLPPGQYDRKTGERFIETFTKGNQEVEALRGLRKLVENGTLSYSDLDQTLFAKGGGISSERRSRFAISSGGAKSRIPLDLDAYDALLKKRQTEAENFAREAANEGNIYTANVMRVRAEAFGLNDVEALNRFNQLLAMNPVTGKSDAQTIEDYLILMAQAERLTGEPAQKAADDARELLDFAKISEDTVNFYNAVMEFRTK